MDMPAGSGRESPLWMRLVKDDEGIKWANIIVMLTVTVASAYLAARAQRAATSPDTKSPAMMLAETRIRLGNYLQRTGRYMEASGWELYERERAT